MAAGELNWEETPTFLREKANQQLDKVKRQEKDNLPPGYKYEYVPIEGVPRAKKRVIVKIEENG